jgi:nitrate/TMAO reductase-like tetraheme cytochrome c subunit
MRFLALLACTLLLGCPADEPSVPDAGVVTGFTREQLLDPESCQECHPDHYQEWSGSMHAYAAEDPVFLAMNRRGQRETNGELGDFCVTCHAPIALREGLTTDGLNLAELPAYSKGVTCAFCHFVDEVTGSHNAQLNLSSDLRMRGAYDNPAPNKAHASMYSPLHDKERIESADLCGSCHDIVTPKQVHLERTFLEWKSSLFAHDVEGERQTCGDCHMKGRTGTAADAPGVPLRRVHDHRMVGVDTALTDFPEKQDQLRRVQRELNTTVLSILCVRDEEGTVLLGATLENMAAGHSWPTGATQDRRAWVEIIAYDEADNVLFASGVVEEGQALTSIVDPQLWRLGDQGYDEDGHAVHLFWEIAEYESLLLPPPNHAHEGPNAGKVGAHLQHEYRFSSAELPARVTLRLRLRAIGLDVLDDLIASGDLAPEFRGAVPTFEMGATQIEWRRADRFECVPVGHPPPVP